MDDDRKTLFNQIKKEKQEEYDKIFSKKYRRISGALFLISCIAIDILDLEQNIYAYAVAVIIMAIFSFWWEKKERKKL